MPYKAGSISRERDGKWVLFLRAWGTEEFGKPWAVRKEKEMRRILLALALVGMATTAAAADTYVWWDLVGSNCEAVVKEAGQGHTLVIEKPLIATAGFYEFELIMKMSNTVANSTQGLTGYGTNLFKDAADPDAPAIMAASWVNGNPLSWTGTVSGNINVGNKILDNTGRKTATGNQRLYAGNSPQSFITLVLRINVATEEFCDWHYFYQSVGAALYAQAPVGAHNVFFGPNPSVYGNAQVEQPVGLPVIAIHAVPEPATLALLGFGFLALIRRR